MTRENADESERAMQLTTFFERVQLHAAAASECARQANSHRVRCLLINYKSLFLQTFSGMIVVLIPEE